MGNWFEYSNITVSESANLILSFSVNLHGIVSTVKPCTNQALVGNEILRMQSYRSD